MSLALEPGHKREIPLFLIISVDLKGVHIIALSFVTLNEPYNLFINHPYGTVGTVCFRSMIVCIWIMCKPVSKLAT